MKNDYKNIPISAECLADNCEKCTGWSDDQAERICRCRRAWCLCPTLPRNQA